MSHRTRLRLTASPRRPWDAVIRPLALDGGLEVLLVDPPQVLLRLDGRREVVGRAVKVDEFVFSKNT
jgi:hypothetical protein